MHPNLTKQTQPTGFTGCVMLWRNNLREKELSQQADCSQIDFIYQTYDTHTLNYWTLFYLGLNSRPC